MPQRIAIIVNNLGGGGVQRMLMLIGEGMAERGHDVDLLSLSSAGELNVLLPDHVRRVELRSGSKLDWVSLAMRRRGIPWRDIIPLLSDRKGPSAQLVSLPSLVDYLEEMRPQSLFAATLPINVLGSIAVACSRHKPRLMVSIRSHIDDGKEKRIREYRKFRHLYRHVHNAADTITAVSQGVKDNFVERFGIAEERVTVIHSPTLTPDFELRANEPVDHPWFRDGGPPVILAVGRPSFQKDFETLVEAFVQLRRRRPVRLMILGGKDSSNNRKRVVDSLQAKIDEAGMQGDFDMPGWTPNPLAYMKNADVLALSSRYEGLPNVVIEALACGTAVVSTDCPSGPAEILDDGRYGQLVPVGDSRRFAEAIEYVLDNPPDPELLRQRAQVYNRDVSLDTYEKLLIGDGS
ncbi:MAG: glycosyltransferase [Geminicoccaceae bacterium]|nr:glycosyltransferase [Geminicoccaceae bacterium]